MCTSSYIFSSLFSISARISLTGTVSICIKSSPLRYTAPHIYNLKNRHIGPRSILFSDKRNFAWNEKQTLENENRDDWIVQADLPLHFSTAWQWNTSSKNAPVVIRNQDIRGFLSVLSVIVFISIWFPIVNKSNETNTLWNVI